MNEEILRIQKMVAEGKVTPEEAAELIESLGVQTSPRPAVNSNGIGLSRERAARWSFYLLLAAVGLGIVSIAASSTYQLYGDDNVSLRFLETLCGISAWVAVFASFVLGRLALSDKLLPGERLTGWPRIQASVAPAVVSVGLLGLILVGLPALVGILAKLLVNDHVGGHIPDFIPFFGAAGVFLVVEGLVGMVIVRKYPGFLRTVFRPLLDGLEARHGKYMALVPVIGFVSMLAAGGLFFF